DGDGRRGYRYHAGQQRGDAHAPGRLDDQLVALQQHQQRPGDVLLGDRDDLVDVLADVREGQIARAAYGDTVGDRGEVGQAYRVAGRERLHERGRAVRLYADDVQVRAEGLGGH